jgi:hypothetical protein
LDDRIFAAYGGDGFVFKKKAKGNGLVVKKTANRKEVAIL